MLNDIATEKKLVFTAEIHQALPLQFFSCGGFHWKSPGQNFKKSFNLGGHGEGHGVVDIFPSDISGKSFI